MQQNATIFLFNFFLYSQRKIKYFVKYLKKINVHNDNIDEQ